jgi:hypothetical protein
MLGGFILEGVIVAAVIFSIIWRLLNGHPHWLVVIFFASASTWLIAGIATYQLGLFGNAASNVAHHRHSLGNAA